MIRVNIQLKTFNDKIQKESQSKTIWEQNVCLVGLKKVTNMLKLRLKFTSKTRVGKKIVE